MSYFARTNPEHAKRISEEDCYIDISGVPASQLPTILPGLAKYRDRFLFGSDWPEILFIVEQAPKIEELPFNSDTIEAMLWGNGHHLLRIDSNHDQEKR